MIQFVLPWPPSVNTYYRRGAHATYMSKAGRKFKTDVADIVSQSKQSKVGAARIRINMVVWPRDRRKFDLDNRIKSVLDSLQDAGVFDDDEQIDEINIARGNKIVSGGCVHVLIEVIE